MGLIGSEQPVHDAWGKATGETKYAADYDVPGLAHLCLIFSTIPHGEVKQVRCEKALAVEGVYGVFHCFNTTEKKFSHYRTMAAQSITLADEERSFKRYIRYVGDRVAAVAARDLETARYAASLVEVEYKEYPAALNFDEALAGKNLIDGQKAVVGEMEKTFGTPPECGPDTREIVTESEIARLHHAAMEPHVCVADYQASTDSLTLYSPNQAVHGIRTVVADYLEMSYSKVRVVKTTMGGSFGGKQEWFLEPVAALVARMLRRPVKLVFRRGDSMVSTVVRAAMRMTLKGTYTLDGRILGMDAELVADAGAYLGNSMDYVGALYGKFFRLYDIPYVHYHVRVVSTNTPVSGAYRSWSAAEAATFIDQNMNQAAVRLGVDPIEIHAKNVRLAGSTDPNLNLPMEKFRAREAISLGRKQFDWDKKMSEDLVFNRSSRRYRRGVGIGCAAHGNTYFPRHQDFAQANLRVNEDGSVQALITLHDHGCGTVRAFQMILAQALEIPMEQILVGEGDTAYTPFDYGCFASRTTFVVGRAAYGCAQKLRELMLDSAAEIEQIPQEDLYIQDAVIRSRTNTEFSYTYGQIALASTLKLRRELSVQYNYCNHTNPGVMGAHFAHVEVDTYTGMTRLLDYLAVHDIGQAINKALCVAQIQGAVQMGCGAALREKLEVDGKGRTTSSLSKYHVCLATDMPEIQVELIQDGKSEEGPYGAKSIGEVCYAPVAAAVCAAVNRALDSDIGTLPMEPAVILRYLDGRKQNED